MQRLTALLACVLLISSCNNIDDEPLTETALIAGETEQPGVQYTPIGTNYLFTDVAAVNGLLVSKVGVDLDKDGADDLAFELNSGSEDGLQLLMVKSLQSTLIPEGVDTHQSLVRQKGDLLAPYTMNWLSNEWLFLHYAKADESWTAGSITTEAGFLPIQIDNHTGWLELQLLTDASQEKIWGINLKQLAISHFNQN